MDLGDLRLETLKRQKKFYETELEGEDKGNQQRIKSHEVMIRSLDEQIDKRLGRDHKKERSPK